MATSRRPVGPFPAGVDEEEYDRRRRRVLWKFPSGLYLLGSHDGTRRNLMTASLVSQVCIEPKLVGVAVEHDAVTYELIMESKAFSLSILGREDRALVRHFVKPATDDRQAMTLSGATYFDASVSGSPVLSEALAFVDCRLFQQIDFGSHALVVGEVVDAGFLSDEDRDVLRTEDTRMSYGG